MKLSAASAKTWKGSSKIFFKMAIMDLYLLYYFCILLKSWLASDIKVLLSKIVDKF